MKQYTPLVLAAVLLFAIGGCSLLQQAAGTVQMPEVRYDSMQFSSVNFDGLSMNFGFEVDNPNRLALRATGYEYAFSVEGSEFLQGRSDAGLELAAGSARTVQIPVTVGFQELYNTAGALVRQDSIAYEVRTEFVFDLPVLGRRSVPASASGYLPVPRMPRLALEDIAVRSVSFSGAEVVLQLRLDNPNAFGMSLSGLAYNLSVDGNQWVSSTLRETISVPAKSSQNVNIPVRLDLTQLGLSVYRMLTGSQSFTYEVDGNGMVDLDLPFFPSTELPFNLSGDYRF
ncbi:MAG: Conserved secreted protein [Bacteroidetes bacterium HLUCCA01]|nr:MAG: Conserved secreted protein [Bacteroidetes bacterium HLUCCA01]